MNFSQDSDLTPLRQYELIYVASPYSKYIWGIDAAFDDIAKITGRLIRNELNVYSPIVHTHKIAIASGMDPLDHSLWMKIDETLMNKSDALLVVKMQGWQESYGVNYEVRYFDTRGKPIHFFDPGTVR